MGLKNTNGKTEYEGNNGDGSKVSRARLKHEERFKKGVEASEKVNLI